MDGPSIILTLTLMWACATGGPADEKDLPSTQSNVGLALNAEADSTSKSTANEAATPESTGAADPKLFKRPAGAAPPSQNAAESSSSGSSAVGVAWYRSGMVSMAAVLALIGAMFWAARKFMPGAAARSSGVMNLAARAALSPKHSVALLQVGRRRFVLVGISSDRLATLADMTDAEEVAELAALTLSAPSVTDRKFERELTQASKAFEPPELVEPTPPDDKRRHVADARGQLEALLARLKGKNAA
ncbi:MAG: flagellar biosynthetic protein FliO [Phycisphaerales bacterium]|nr:flagellar biosynthetic protein FliO [Phycisphaerales bacterium]